MGLTLPASETASIKARQLTYYALMSWGLGRLYSDARIIVTALVDNTIKAVTLHESVSSEIGLRLRATGRSLMIEVEDPLAEWLPRRIDEAMELRFISVLSDDWDIRPSTTGKIVWATLSDEPPTYLSGAPWPASGEPWQERKRGTG
ncbi:ATP-binding protein [Streptomyces sp. F001]|uniref:ATP-binding protein n=1 Tax=Streptomyces sp. F001 TaxID=1510026 RepID=UPI00101E4F52|nr:ATP-binding protein [Streptomyces sp. F001]